MFKTYAPPLAAALLLAAAAAWHYRSAPTRPAPVAADAATAAEHRRSSVLPASRTQADLPAPELRGSAPPARARPRARELEARFVVDGKFSADAALRAAHSQDSFDALLSALADGYYTDPEAIETGALFQRRIASALEQGEAGIGLRQLACGHQVCAAQLEGAELPPLRLLELLMRANRDGGAKIQTSSIKRVPPAPGRETTAYRIVFSTDPQVSTIVAAPPQP